MDGAIVFQVNTGGWTFNAQKNVDTNTSAWEMLQFLVHTTKGVDGVVGLGLKKMVDFGKVEAVLREAPETKNPHELGKTIAFLNTRKISQVINEVSALEGYQTKEKNEIAQFIRLYSTRLLMARAQMFANYSGEFFEAKGSMAGKITMISNNVQWSCVKKMSMLEETSPRTIMEFMGSFSVSMDNKMEHYLGKIVDLKKMGTFLDSSPSGKSAGELESVFRFLAGSELTKNIEQLVANSNISMSEKEKLVKLLHVYAVRCVLEKCKVFVKYAQVDIPGLKRLLKKKA